MDIRSIPLDQLNFGHDATPPINVRKVGRSDDIITLAASIAAHGLGQALNVRDIDGVYYVADGNRRLAALHHNRDAGTIAPDAPIACNFDATAGSEELSLALNIERLPMHEADTYEAFRDLHAKGLSEPQIAGRFGIEEKRVRRMLAIGRLHPDILEAWRNNELGNQTVETVRTFTLATSLEQQAEVFHRLKAKHQLYPHAIREALGIGDRALARLMTFVGIDAYLAAGGVMVEDLFGDNHRIENPELVHQLVASTIDTMKAELEAEGWSWVAFADDLPEGWSWNWRQIHPEGEGVLTKEEKSEIRKLKKIVGKSDYWNRSPQQADAAARIEAIENLAERRLYTSEQKQQSGAVISIGREGHPDVTAGKIDPGETKIEKPVKEKPPSGLSNAVMERLSIQLTLATQDALATDGRTALAATLAAMAVNYTSDAPLKIRLDGMSPKSAEATVFADALAFLLERPADSLVEMLGAALLPAVCMRSFNAFAPPLEKTPNAALVNTLPAEAMNAALRKRFDAEDYFKSVARPLAIKAIAEALNEDEARKAGKLKKPELVAFALANVVRTGWLPPELRTAHYDGPAGADEPEELAEAAQ
jgi:ParB family chromosome partitioning protein